MQPKWSQDTAKIESFENCMQEFNMYHIYDRHKASGYEVLSIGISKITIKNNNNNIISDEEERR